MFRCCQTTINRAIRNHMDDDVEDDDAIISNAELPVDVSVMLGLKESDDEKAPASPNHRWRPWAPTKGLTSHRTIAPVPRMAGPRNPKASVEATGSSDNSNPHPVVTAKSEASSTLPPPWEKKLTPDDLSSVEGFIASIQLGGNHAQMLLDEGIKTHQDLLHIKEILGTESLRLVKDSLKARGFTTFELIKFISAVKGMPA